VRRASVILALTALAACQSLVDVDLGAGIGAPCGTNDECQGSSCLDGICTVRCADDAGCPGGTICSREICELPLRVGYVYPFPISQDELAQSVDLGRIGVETELAYVSSAAVENKPLAAEATDAALDLVAQGSSVIVATSSGQAQAFAALSAANPEVNVLVLDSPVASADLTSVAPRMYQAYYLAGFAAARKSATRRLGMIASVPTPSVIARINAFALGARRALEPQSQEATIEIRWMGDWHDTGAPVENETKEVRDTRDLLLAGADVVAHTLDNNIPLTSMRYIIDKDQADALTSGFAVAANLAAGCEGAASPECIGSAYYNWTPILSAAFQTIQREEELGGFLRMGIAVSEAESAVGFRVGAAAPAGVDAEIDAIRAELLNEEGVGPIFDGPILSVRCSQLNDNQTPCVAEGERLSEEELARMCWFIDDVGLVERQGGTDLPAVVPAGCEASLPPVD
jgi:simple sugar transport system substrate-binding protein